MASSWLATTEADSIVSKLGHSLRCRGYSFTVTPEDREGADITIPGIYGESRTAQVVVEDHRILMTTVDDDRLNADEAALARGVEFCDAFAQTNGLLRPSFDSGVYCCTTKVAVDHTPTLDEIDAVLGWVWIADEVLWWSVDDVLEGRMPIEEAVVQAKSELDAHLLSFLSHHSPGRLLVPRDPATTPASTLVPNTQEGNSHDCSDCL